MKIYFEDGELRSPFQLPFSDYYKVDASRGYSENEQKLESIRAEDYNATVYTNQIAALQTKYCWNEELKVPELYIRAGEHMIFTRIDECTDKELRYAHNLMRMYMSGTFE